MAINDWNGDDKMDGFDAYVEYENLYHGDEDDGLDWYHSKYTGSCNSGGMSTFGAILYTISGLVEQALLYSIFDIEVDDVPAIIMIILWILFSFITVALVSAIKR